MQPPDHFFSDEARAVWEEIVPELLSRAWFDPLLDRVSVIGYCTLQARAQAIQARLDAASPGHEADLLAEILGSTTDQVFKFANALGLTPASRREIENRSPDREPWEE